ncbi:MAG: chromosomal replication initiator protein DnaA [Candidatus Bruticola sp.]
MANQAVSAECLDILWHEFLSETESPLNTFLEQCSPKNLSGDVLTIITPNKVLRDFLKKPDRLERILASLKTCFNSDSIKIEFVIGLSERNNSDQIRDNVKIDNKKSTNTDNKPIIKEKIKETVQETKTQQKVEYKSDNSENLKLNSKNSEWNSNLQENLLFENFVTGSNNSIAAATAKAVAQSPGVIYNPLFFYSGVGLGKTHLINAIGNSIVKTNPNLKVLYTSAEQFANEFVESITSNTNQRFRDKFRNVDVLLIDDIHFIIGKPGTQEELFQTIDALKRSNRQIVISSDCPPKQMNTVMSRLRSRFEWGMIADIQPPDLETREAILRQKAANNNISDDIIEYIASEFYSNIRELEGALIRVISYCSIMRKELTLENAKEALKELLDHSKDKKVDINEIKKVVCDYFQISEKDLISSRRDQRIVKPRQLAMYLCKEMVPGASYPEIGAQFGGRDHTTVIHAYRKVENNLDDELYKTPLNNLKERLK